MPTIARSLTNLPAERLLTNGTLNIRIPGIQVNFQVPYQVFASAVSFIAHSAHVRFVDVILLGVFSQVFFRGESLIATIALVGEYGPV